MAFPQRYALWEWPLRRTTTICGGGTCVCFASGTRTYGRLSIWSEFSWAVNGGIDTHNKIGHCVTGRADRLLSIPCAQLIRLCQKSTNIFEGIRYQDVRIC